MKYWVIQKLFLLLVLTLFIISCGSSTDSNGEVIEKVTETEVPEVTTTEVPETTTTITGRSTLSFGEEPLDFLNATFNVRCPGILGGGAYPYLATFSNGEAVDFHGTIEVTELKKVELVEESPGLETIISVWCWGGGSGTSSEIQIFSANPDRPARLGSIIHANSDRFIEDGEYPFMLLQADWHPDDLATMDPTVSASIDRLYKVEWDGKDWKRFLLDEWRVDKETGERLQENLD